MLYLIFALRESYIKMVCGLTILVLGPWIGFQGLALLQAYPQLPLAQTLGLCSSIYIMSIVLLMNPSNKTLICIWSIVYFIMIVGHWIVFAIDKKTTSHNPDSITEFKEIYILFTIAYICIVLIPVGYILMRLFLNKDKEEVNGENFSCPSEEYLSHLVKIKPIIKNKEYQHIFLPRNNYREEYFISA